MRPEPWNPPIELSKKEQKIVQLIKRAKLFTFLREIRHLLFDEPFQEELSKMYAEADAKCPLRSKCTTSKRGRSVSIHPDEKFIAELRERQLTSQGRAKLRERVAVEHSLSHIGRWQGDKARYIGTRKNLFDLRRTAVVHNLHVLARIGTKPKEPVAIPVAI